MLLLFSGALHAATDPYETEVLKILGLVQNKQYQKAIDAYKKVLQTPSLARWQVSASYADLAYLYFMVNQSDTALDAFEKAVQSGYDDFIAVHEQAAFKPYYENARFKAAYGKMRISPADTFEIYWLSGEIQSAIHDMTMMIQENTGRKDAVFTDVPQQQIPTRKTSSAGVMTNRMVLDIIQRMQRDNVRQSDLSRINHLMQMGIINQMPGGKDSSSAASAKEVQESGRRADDLARQRRQAIEKRRFVLPPGIFTTPAPAPPLVGMKTGAH